MPFPLTMLPVTKFACTPLGGTVFSAHECIERQGKVTSFGHPRYSLCTPRCVLGQQVRAAVAAGDAERKAEKRKARWRVPPEKWVREKFTEPVEAVWDRLLIWLSTRENPGQPFRMIDAVRAAYGVMQTKPRYDRVWKLIREHSGRGRLIQRMTLGRYRLAGAK